MLLEENLQLLRFDQCNVNIRYFCRHRRRPCWSRVIVLDSQDLEYTIFGHVMNDSYE